MTAFIEKIHKYDSIISYRLCDLRSREALTSLMVLASRLGGGPFCTVLGVVMFALGGVHGRRAAFLLVISTAVCIGIFKAMKGATTRKRPFEVYPDLVIDARMPPPDRFSFPSGHSMNAFAVAVLYGHYFPALLVPLLLFAALIAASRVFLALHYPSDVVAGAIVGSSVAAGLIIMIG